MVGTAHARLCPPYDWLAFSIAPSTSAAVGIDGAAPIRCTQMDAAALA